MIETIIKQRAELAMLIWKAFLMKKVSRTELVLQKMAAENFYQMSELSCLAWPSTVSGYTEELTHFGKSLVNEPDQNTTEFLSKLLNIEREIKVKTEAVLQNSPLTDMMKRGLEVLAKQHENYLSELESEQVASQAFAS